MLYVFEQISLPMVFLIGRTVADGDWTQPLRIIQEYELILVYRGQATFFIQDRTYTIKQGEYILLPPYVAHYAVTSSDAPVCYYYLHFNFDCASHRLQDDEAKIVLKERLKEYTKERHMRYWDMPKMSFGLYLPEWGKVNERREDVYGLFEEALYERSWKLPNSDVVLGACVVQVLIQLSRLAIKDATNSLDTVQQEMPRSMESALRYIHDNYQRNLTIEEISQHIGITPQYLARMFKNNMGMKPLQFINQLRINRAKYLLRNSNMSVKEISDSVGVDNPYYFSRLFKRAVGLTPRSFTDSRKWDDFG